MWMRWNIQFSEKNYGVVFPWAGRKGKEFDAKDEEDEVLECDRFEPSILGNDGAQEEVVTGSPLEVVVQWERGRVIGPNLV